MNRKSTGEYIVTSTAGEKCRAFVPAPLPPAPPLVMDPALRELCDRALLSIGRLDSAATLLPDVPQFLYMYIRKEALLSSQIEGTQSSLADLLVYEMDGAPGVPLEDVEEVSNYIAAINHGVMRIRKGFPLSLRLIREIHGIMLSKGRRSRKTPGEFRRSQNWIGGSRPGNAVFVPPPPDRLIECMGALEMFLHDQPSTTPTLIKAALAHIQFETIHPFLDGNGRVGRLLITLILCGEDVLSEPLLYLSLFFKENRREYYDHLQNVRLKGDWESWLKFFMTAVTQTADQAVAAAKEIAAIAAEDRTRIMTLGKLAPSALKVHQALLRQPVLSISKTREATGLWVSSATAVMARLQELGIVSELTGRRRNRLFGYNRYIKLLSEGTEPL